MFKERFMAGIAVLGLCLSFAGCQGTIDTPVKEKKMLSVAKDGKSDYQIILPEKFADKNIEKFLKDTAALMQQSFKEGAGAAVPIVQENAADKKKPGIFIGNTEFAKTQGIDVSKFQGWTYMSAVYGNNIVLIGNDRQGNPEASHYSAYFLGSVKAAITFMEQNMGVRFLLPGSNGTEIPKIKEISVSSNLNEKITAPIEYCSGRQQEMFYDIANNFFGPAGIKLYGGHSYYDAVPKAVYAEKHPEYFALLGGKRIPVDNHLCISNPEVQNLIYAEMLKWLDKGYDMVELNETDGYRPCECENCKKLYGVDDPGEKLWILHRDLAARLLKDRPGKKVMTLAYGPTAAPPATFKNFPENMMIELCLYTQEYFEEWSKYSVPAGFTAYIYNWGNYQRVGLTPKRSPKFCEDQVNLFVQNNVKGIYRCGFGELMGMEGPVYYVYGKTLGNVKKTAAASAQPWVCAEAGHSGASEKSNYTALLEDFYRNAYGEAAAPMRAFFEIMYPRLEAYSMMERNGSLPLNPRVVLAFIYSPDVLNTMSKNLDRAKALATSPKAKIRIALVEKEFEYVKNLASIIHLYNAYYLKMNQQNFDQLAVEIDKRQAMIESFFDDKEKMRPFPGWPEVRFLGNDTKNHVIINSRLSGQLGAPYNWNTGILRKNNILPGVGKKTMKVVKASDAVTMAGSFDQGAWKKAEAQDLGEIQLGTLSLKTKFKAIYDNENIYIAFNAELPGNEKYTACGQDGPSWGQECFEIFIDPFGSREKHYHFIFNPVDNSRYDAAVGFITDPLDPRYGKPDVSWNGSWEYKNILADGMWTAFVKIPFKTLGIQAPAKGSNWCVNIGREHHIKSKNNAKASIIEYSLWSPNLETINFCDPEAFGEAVFE